MLSSMYFSNKKMFTDELKNCITGMLARDYCDRKFQAVSDAQEFFPPFSAGSNDCSPAGEIMLGKLPHIF
jgi:hypothetical protein